METDVHRKISHIVTQGKGLLVLTEQDTVARSRELMVASEFTFFSVVEAFGSEIAGGLRFVSNMAGQGVRHQRSGSFTASWRRRY